MGTEDCILKGTKLITNTKKKRLKNLEQRLDSQKYNIKKKPKPKQTNKQKPPKKQTKNTNHRNYKKYIYEICFKNRVFLFFLQGIRL